MLSICFSTVPIFFADQDDLQKILDRELRNLEKIEQEKIAALKGAEDREKKLHSIRQILVFLEKNQEKTREELTVFEENLTRVEKGIERLKKEVTEFDARIKNLEGETRLKLAVFYKLMRIREFSYLPSIDFLLNYRRNQFYLSGLSRDDARELREFTQIFDRKKKKLSELGQLQNDAARLAEEKRVALETLDFDREQQKIYLAHLSSEQESGEEFLKKINLEFDYLNNEINRLRSEREHERERVKREKASIAASRSGFGGSKGKLGQPLNGSLVKRFGERNGEENYRLFKRGILIKPLEGETHSKAVQPGKVVYSGIMKGYGNVVILDHGKSSFSVYGLLNNPFVKKGETVPAGGALGDLLPSFDEKHGTLLYFEMRYRNRPVNPNEWLNPAYPNLAKPL